MAARIYTPDELAIMSVCPACVLSRVVIAPCMSHVCQRCGTVCDRSVASHPCLPDDSN